MRQQTANGRRTTSKLKYDSLVVWAFVQLVCGVGWVWKGRMECAEGWELRGLVRVVSARKNTEVHKAPRSRAVARELASVGVWSPSFA